MKLHLLQHKSLEETQDDFNRAYPFLRIEFMKRSEPGGARRILKGSMPMTAVGLKSDGEVELHDAMTVGELENAFFTQFGLSVQLSRRSGNLWLETIMTNSWTLKQQNEHGRELTEHISPKIRGS